MKKHIFAIVFIFVSAFPAFGAAPDASCLADAAMLDKLQQDAFKYMWDGGEANSGMAYEGNFDWGQRPVAVGGTGFGVAAIVVAADRGWISREEAVTRLRKITLFLRDKTPRKELHGAFPHWLDGASGQTVSFDKRDNGADIVETSLLMQGLLIARAYFNGPGPEAELRSIITALWEGVDWNWFTNGEENGLYWHWSPKTGHSGLRILGNNECLITYVLALASPTRPISRKAYGYWTSGNGYKPKNVYGYRIEAALPGAGPLFLAHYSFIGLDPRHMADSFVPGGYFARNTRHTLSNRGYCLQNAPAANLYSAGYWGLTASQVKGGYAATEPSRDSGTVAPTAAISSMPYTPHYSMQVLGNILAEPRGAYAELRKKLWGPHGPYDAFSLRDKWVSDRYLAIDQLPMVCMVENYRSGLLWNLLMSDADVRAGLEKAGIHEPEFATGFPEAVVTLLKKGGKYLPDAYDLRRHPDSGLYLIPYWNGGAAAEFTFIIKDSAATQLMIYRQKAAPGRNTLAFEQFHQADGKVLTFILQEPDGTEHRLPVRLH